MLISCSIHSLTPEKLDDKNFPSWFSSVSANLTAHRLLPYVDGSRPSPSSTVSAVDKEGKVTLSPNPEYEKWLIIDDQLRACLLAIISPSVHPYLHGQTTAAAIWSHLQLRDS
ncbi:unnamed protein product [Cuscuta campestris]|uniref:Retrotransposon Copia-like N-terminal domain-containing protein n=1 Tax=Cuscuta campestris TaxID=132261 RepID=A0A484KGT5_9ASTE|nr:unnamed protein product [Cuscuta campestris]